jgi:hypothetical protein
MQPPAAAVVAAHFIDFSNTTIRFAAYVHM